MDLLAKLDAIEGIKLAKARHQRAVDTKDFDLLARVFADDVEIDCRGVTTDPVSGVSMSPGMESVIHGIEDALALSKRALADVVSVHHVSTPEIEITGPTTGSAVWPQIDRLWFPPGAAFRQVIGYGWYHETYERVGDDWRIKTMSQTRARLDFIPW
jgi:hypothetical protein